MQVTHNTFGLGTIISHDPENVTVDFNGTVKTFVIKFAKLTKEDGTPYGVQYVAPIKKAKKLNKANFMSAKDWQSSDYYNMSKSDYEDMRKIDALKSIGIID